MRAADTTVVIRLLVQDDPAQSARARAEAGHGLWVSHVVLLEVARVLECNYGRNRQRIAQAVGQLLNATEFAVQEPEVVRAAVALAAEHSSIGFSDCLVLAVAARAGQLPLATFDSSLGGVDGAEHLI